MERLPCSDKIEKNSRDRKENKLKYPPLTFPFMSRAIAGSSLFATDMSLCVCVCVCG